MQDFYKDLNFERDENRWYQWAQHREEISGFIGKTISSPSDLGNAIILGAGNCDDLDFQLLGTLFEAITLSDIDGQAMEEAVKRIDFLNLCREIHMIPNLDFTKLDQIHFYDRLERMLVQRASANEISLFLSLAAKEIRIKDVLSHLKRSFSMVISSAVYSQIFYIHVLSLFAKFTDRYSEKEVRYLMRGFIYLRDEVIKNYNDLMISLVKENGKVLVWTDILQTDVEMNREITEGLYNINTDQERWTYLRELVTMNGREASLFGIADLSGKLADDGQLFHFWNWPFNDERQYLIFGISGTPAKLL
ncbi:hypothetical protein P5G65_23545 [Paenibacillus chondroitinus]|uniref:CheR-type methyltransferase domain-containing protein n=1 Tax=Paenibacillus chondroitinus TaxID=59842 RepID=A0ABU6DHN5_9BACL|nr:hypothetical protein [Paenibacillus chondroitinus]MEB4796880.1 hypothetical protein [Paenibacillus chondroitinus]